MINENNIEKTERYVTNKENKSFFKLASESLTGRWGDAVITSILIGLVSIVSGFIPLASIVISGPIALGAAIWALKFVRKEDYRYEDVFEGFKHFGNAFVLLLLQGLIILGFMLLLIIPGIIAAFALSQTFFLLADNPNMKPMDAIRKSNEMMKGHKGELFGISVMFFFMFIGCIFTLGIGFFFLIPYMRITLTHFYLNLIGDEDHEMEEIDHLIID